MIGQSHISFTLLSVKDGMLFQHVSKPFKCWAWGTDMRHSEANLDVIVNLSFSPFVYSLRKDAADVEVVVRQALL
jgi:hypothetical protein